MLSKLGDPEAARPLFGEAPGIMVRACLEGAMGSVCVPTAPGRPASAVALLGDFAFFAGSPDAELLRWQPDTQEPAPSILVAPDEAWAALVERTWGGDARVATRYAFDPRETSFDRAHLKDAAGSLPPGFSLTPINAGLFARCLENPWSRDFVANYPSAEAFARRGRGWAVLRGEDLVAGASSYASCRAGIEIQVETDLPYRRLGLARACCARLILDCLDHGLYPSWDAANEASRALALGLGYGEPHPYPAYLLGL